MEFLSTTLDPDLNSVLVLEPTEKCDMNPQEFHWRGLDNPGVEDFGISHKPLSTYLTTVESASDALLYMTGVTITIILRVGVENAE